MLNLRYLSAAVLCVAAACLPCLAQTSATFTTHTYPVIGNQPRNVYAVDVNNDGTPDIIYDSINLPNRFSVYLAKGDGTFTASYAYTFPFQYQSTVPLGSGDFNGDGIVDLIFALDGSNQIAVFLGRGDGTFQTPMFETVALPSGVNFATSPLVAADFTGDGKLDLMAVGYTNNISALYRIPGNGNGTFGTATTVYTPPSNSGVGYQIAAGDFDADGKADVAFLETYNCNPGNCASTLHVMYGNGAGVFMDTTPYSDSSVFSFTVGDLNSDGRTDIFGTSGSTDPSIVLLYGQTSRTFNLYTHPTGLPAGYSINSTLTMADFNGDGRMDLVALTANGNTSEQMQVFLANSSPASFTRETFSMPYYENVVNPVVGDFNKDTKPDVVYIGQTNNSSQSNPFIVEALNTTASGNWGGCAYPASGMGIRLCAPIGSTPSPVRFNASANSYGPLRKIELWVDGKKIGEQWHAWEQRAWFNLKGTIAAGNHSATLYAADVDNRLQRLNFSFNVVSCSVPSSPGVHVCSPVNGSSVGSPVQATAAATVTGTIQRMEVWVDGVKKYSTYNTNWLSTSIALPTGSHRFDFYVVNTTGAKWVSTVYATVK
jgi:hypothetical protein